jgi:hypothetical protein
MRAIADGDEGPACASRDLLRLLVHTLIISEFLRRPPKSLPSDQARLGGMLR